MPFNPEWSEFDTREPKELKKFGPDESNNTAVRIISENIESRLDQIVDALNNGGPTGNNQIVEKIPFTILPGSENTWVDVPLTQIVDVVDVTTFDINDYQIVFCDVRLINNATGVQIKTTRSLTITVHIEGYA